MTKGEKSPAGDVGEKGPTGNVGKGKRYYWRTWAKGPISKHDQKESICLIKNVLLIDQLNLQLVKNKIYI